MSKCSHVHVLTQRTWPAALSNAGRVDILFKGGSMVVDVQYVYGHSDWLADHFTSSQSLNLEVQFRLCVAIE